MREGSGRCNLTQPYYLLAAFSDHAFNKTKLAVSQYYEQWSLFTSNQYRALQQTMAFFAMLFAVLNLFKQNALEVFFPTCR